MTTPTSPDPDPKREPPTTVTLDGVAALADVGARLFDLAARTGLVIGAMPADERYDKLQEAMEHAAEAARAATVLVVELSRKGA